MSLANWRMLSTPRSGVVKALREHRFPAPPEEREDVEFPGGVLVMAVDAGDLTFRAVDGDTDHTMPMVAGQILQLGFVNPIAVRVVRGTSTVNSLIFGFL